MGVTILPHKAVWGLQESTWLGCVHSAQEVGTLLSFLVSYLVTTPMLGLAAREGSGEELGLLSVVRRLRHLQHAGAYLYLHLGVHRALGCLAPVWY